MLHDLPPQPLSPDDLARLIDLLRGRRVVALTGAGCSTESGIPDYRGPTTRHRTRNPIMYADFVKNADTRQRYWARAFLGWPRMHLARPNPAHTALAALQRCGVLQTLITQNVDGLHQAAGSTDVIELHGALAAVRCLDCGHTSPRADLQRRLEALNPLWADLDAASAPDGDAELEAERARSFQIAPCGRCGGVLKPDVVFFGENVPPTRVTQAFKALDDAEVLLIAGSSLTVWSGFRFLRHAHLNARPAAAINLGPLARGAELLTLHVDARCGEALPAVAQALAAPWTPEHP